MCGINLARWSFLGTCALFPHIELLMIIESGCGAKLLRKPKRHCLGLLTSGHGCTSDVLKIMRLYVREVAATTRQRSGEMIVFSCLSLYGVSSDHCKRRHTVRSIAPPSNR
eukprot:2531347-Amphidinium_carterae.1